MSSAQSFIIEPKANRKEHMPRPKKKKVAAKKAKKKTTKVKKPKTVKEIVEQYNAITIDENESYIELINCIRRSKKEDEANDAFAVILELLNPKIQRLISRFNIPGYEHADVFQEALFALRFKAIKDYDKARGTGDGPALFDKFALLCIRRHLATEFKSSYQNKKRVLNQSVSIDKEQNNNSSNNNSDNETYLSGIIKDPNFENVLTDVAENEYFKDLNDALLSQLSKFEREVYMLYKQKFSYEEIAEKINDKRKKIYVNIKGVDNALSRIKHKAQIILQNYETRNNFFE